MPVELTAVTDANECSRDLYYKKECNGQVREKRNAEGDSQKNERRDETEMMGKDDIERSAILINLCVYSHSYGTQGSTYLLKPTAYCVRIFQFLDEPSRSLLAPPG